MQFLARATTYLFQSKQLSVRQAKTIVLVNHLMQNVNSHMEFKH